MRPRRRVGDRIEQASELGVFRSALSTSTVGRDEELPATVKIRGAWWIGGCCDLNEWSKVLRTRSPNQPVDEPHPASGRTRTPGACRVRLLKLRIEFYGIKLFSHYMKFPPRFFLTYQ